MSIGEIKDVVEILQGIATTLGILLAGLWTFWLFIYSRSFVGIITADLTLTKISSLDGVLVGIIRVRLKNTGRTRAVKGYCLISAEPIQEPVSLNQPYFLGTTALRFIDAQSIFESLVELEPGEEATEEVVLVLSGHSLLKVGTKYKHKHTNETWESSAVFDVSKGINTVET